LANRHQAQRVHTQPPFTFHHQLILLGLTGLACVFRFYHLARESLWFDEALSALFAMHPLGLSIHSMLEEGLHHSPLFYILLRPFATGGFSEFSLRMLPALLGVLSIPLFAQLGRLLASPRVGILAACLLTINPFFVWYSRETRMYSLLFLAAVGATYFFGKCVLEQPRLQDWLALAFFTAIGINTHHFAFFIPLVQLVYILVTFRRNHHLVRRWVGAQSLATLSLLPWLLIVLDWGRFYGSSAAANYRPTVVDVFETAWNFSIGYTEQMTAIVVIVVCLFLAILFLGLRSFTPGRVLLWIWLFVPLLVTFGISFRVSIYMDRYLMIVFPAFLLLVAIGLESIRPVILRLAVSLLIVGTMFGGLGRVYCDKNVYNRADWRGAGAYLDQNVDAATDTIFALYYQDLVPLHFYYHRTVAIRPIIGGETAGLPELPAERSGQRTFLIIDHPNISVHLVGHCQAFDVDRITSDVAIKEWRRLNQDRLTRVEEFVCIRVEIYE
jgi:mannosyltransferase